MWLFDLFNSKVQRQKKEYNQINRNRNYTDIFKFLIAFSETQLMIFRITDRGLKNLLSDGDKELKMLYFFGGAADYATQILNLADDEAINFIAFFIVLTIYNGDYRKMDYAKAMFTSASIISNSDNFKIIQRGGQAYADMLKNEKDVDIHSHGLILKKLLSKS